MPGAVVSLQTLGSFGANFHPHLHVLATRLLRGVLFLGDPASTPEQIRRLERAAHLAERAPASTLTLPTASTAVDWDRGLFAAIWG